MLYANQAVLESGIPLNHGDVFSAVARNENCIIISRSVGQYATGLIQENYATKGFHVKAKSSDWGPMAGFVLADPRFSKNGPKGVVDQQKKISDAIAEGAKKAPVYISQARKVELPQLFAGDEKAFYTEVMISNDEWWVTTVKKGCVISFVLKLRQANQVPGAKEPMWAVCYRHQIELPDQRALGCSGSFGTSGKINTSFGELYQVMGLTDPRGDAATKATYRGVLTGDYDLWGVFPRGVQYDPDGHDKRRVANSNNRLFGIDTFKQHEDQHKGNMTDRIEIVRNKLNAGFNGAGYSGGNIVHHSDEAGRPMVDNIECEAVAFFPDGNKIFFKNVSEYKDFLEMARGMGFKTILNGWWYLYKEMGNERIRHISAIASMKVELLEQIRANGT
ncbi:MAG: hypothetical protein ACI9RZ_000904 [Sphingobacteriales bacterium]|jgi:hypothetical protein